MNPNYNYPPRQDSINPNQIIIQNQINNPQNNLPPIIIKPPQPSKFQILVKQHQLSPLVASQLHTVLSTCKIVLLCDDSSSMSQAIAEEGIDPFAIKRSTRWLQLKKLAASLIQYCSAINPEGLDIHFFNRPSILKVTSLQGLNQSFGQQPDGSTPLCGALRKLFQNYSQFCNGNNQLLIIVITDGEPSDGSRNDLYNVLMSKPKNAHVSFAECTDNQQDMQYLDQWDGLIPNFDNTDDYRQQLYRVKTTQGANFKFDYNDYVVKILLATFIRWYFNLDQKKVQQIRVPASNQNSFGINNGNNYNYNSGNNNYNNTNANNGYVNQNYPQQTLNPNVVMSPMNVNSQRVGKGNPDNQCCLLCQIM